MSGEGSVRRVRQPWGGMASANGMGKEWLRWLTA